MSITDDPLLTVAEAAEPLKTTERFPRRLISSWPEGRCSSGRQHPQAGLR